MDGMLRRGGRSFLGRAVAGGGRRSGRGFRGGLLFGELGGIGNADRDRNADPTHQLHVDLVLPEGADWLPEVDQAPVDRCPERLLNRLGDVGCRYGAVEAGTALGGAVDDGEAGLAEAIAEGARIFPLALFPRLRGS